MFVKLHMLHDVKTDEIGATFGAQVKQARESLGWSQAELATQLGHALGKEVNPLVVTRIEGGKRPVSIVELTALASVFKTTPGKLLEGIQVDTDHLEADRAVGRWITREAAARRALGELAGFLKNHPNTRETIRASLFRTVGDEVDDVMQRLDAAVVEEPSEG
ncbi:helix-turn-helix transcriptional regulator [Streptomyces sp. NPDC002766]|uniref:helix-turn-helix domain-containing protein n=1 Tax=Streptomyces sp. NPDC002766 TaxID=3154429 RepID=UPI00332B8881